MQSNPSQTHAHRQARTHTTCCMDSSDTSAIILRVVSSILLLYVETYIHRQQHQQREPSHTHQPKGKPIRGIHTEEGQDVIHPQSNAVLKLSTKILSYITVVPFSRNVSSKNGYPIFMYYKCWQKSKGNQFLGTDEHLLD